MSWEGPGQSSIPVAQSGRSPESLQLCGQREDCLPPARSKKGGGGVGEVKKKNDREGREKNKVI